ncbi:hypothetical protein KKB83_00700, partial [Patescibacteria group bacterium]|nr:hypothetical protein [Patescibacteria group bacterium]
RGNVIEMEDGDKIIIAPELYKGSWHVKEKGRNGIVNVTYPNDGDGNYVILSPDVFKTMPEWGEPGYHPRVILLRETEGVNLSLSSGAGMKSSDLPCVSVGNNSMSALVELKNEVGWDGKKVDFGEGITVNSHSLLLGLKKDTETELIFPGGKLKMKGIDNESFELALLRE